MKLFSALLVATLVVSQIKITSISPTEGKMGTQVTIQGENFPEGVFVTFGHDRAKIVSKTDTKLVVLAPECSKGKKSVHVIKPDRMPAVAPSLFEYKD